MPRNHNQCAHGKNLFADYQECAECDLVWEQMSLGWHERSAERSRLKIKRLKERIAKEKKVEN